MENINKFTLCQDIFINYFLAPRSSRKRQRGLFAPSLEIIGSFNKKVKTLHFDQVYDADNGKQTTVSESLGDVPSGELHVTDVHMPIIEKPDFDKLNLSDLAKTIYSRTCDMKVMSNSIHRLNIDVHYMIAGVHKRIDSVQQTIEQTVTKKLSDSLDKRMTTEINKMKKHVDGKVDDIIRDVQQECRSNIEESQRNIEELMQRLDLQSSKKSDISNNIALVNIKETNNENVLEKVNNFLEDVIQVPVRAVRAERKGAEGEEPG
ncbi:hypothetical protein DPMN_083370 [Dreissena polymorpha]|uniref:Uncharacterized protein n=1 Tax=Dreissena polymorpha TaxID=45954 RepID=A0A9D3YCI7_DREPO|nr:hypothetical protein DPMN_083370 [Dreissena polymorpha]